MSKKDDFSILFAPENKTEEETSSNTPWKVLLVDDEKDIHAIFDLALRNVIVEDHPLEIISAKSAIQARDILTKQHKDIGLILLDVVMETNTAGLDLVKYIREELNNHAIQIVLVTGQPGYAPQRKVIANYEINGYYLKSELTTERIFAFVYTALRTYKVRQNIEIQRMKLQESEERYIDLYEYCLLVYF